LFLRFNYGARYLTIRFFVVIVVCCRYDQSDTGLKKNFMFRMYKRIMINDDNDSSDIDTLIIWFMVQAHWTLSRPFSTIIHIFPPSRYKRLTDFH